MLCRPNSSWKKKAAVFTTVSAYQDQLKAVFFFFKYVKYAEFVE